MNEKTRRIVRNNNQALLTRVENGNIWYSVLYSTDGPYSIPEVFEFPVPIASASTRTFHRQERAIDLAEWVDLEVVPEERVLKSGCTDALGPEVMRGMRLIAASYQMTETEENEEDGNAIALALDWINAGE